MPFMSGHQRRGWRESETANLLAWTFGAGLLVVVVLSAVFSVT